MIGGKISGGKEFGHPDNTDYFIFGLEAVYTTKNIINIQARQFLLQVWWCQFFSQIFYEVHPLHLSVLLNLSFFPGRIHCWKKNTPVVASVEWPGIAFFSWSNAYAGFNLQQKFRFPLCCRGKEFSNKACSFLSVSYTSKTCMFQPCIRRCTHACRNTIARTIRFVAKEGTTSYYAFGRTWRIRVITFLKDPLDFG